jgi:hypothetical protein
MHAERNKTKEFLQKLIEIWENTNPIRSESDRKILLSIETLLYENDTGDGRLCENSPFTCITVHKMV